MLLLYILFKSVQLVTSLLLPPAHSLPPRPLPHLRRGAAAGLSLCTLKSL